MPKKSKKRARQAKRRSERREAKRPDAPALTSGERLLQRIRTEAQHRREGQARRAEALTTERERRLERDKAKGKL